MLGLIATGVGCKFKEPTCDAVGCGLHQARFHPLYGGLPCPAMRPHQTNGGKHIGRPTRAKSSPVVVGGRGEGSVDSHVGITCTGLGVGSADLEDSLICAVGSPDVRLATYLPTFFYIPRGLFFYYSPH